MLKSHVVWLQSLPRRKKTMLGVSLLCLCCLVLTIVLAHTGQWSPLQNKNTDLASRNAPSLRVQMGFTDNYRSGKWTPLHVTLSNQGLEFKGTLSARTYAGLNETPADNTVSPWSFEQAVMLAPNTQKQVTIEIPHYINYLSARGFIVTLQNEQGIVVSTQTQSQGNDIKPGDLFIGTLTGPQAHFEELNKVSLNLENTTNISALNANTLPTTETVLENFDVIVLDDFPSSTLNNRQISALRTWVNRGGILIEAGGQDWQRTLGVLPADMLPVTIQGTSQIPAGTHFLPQSGPPDPNNPAPSDTLTAPLTISTATVHKQNAFSSSQIILAESNKPLIVQAHQGAGIICYLAFDPAAASLRNWAGTISLWQSILHYALGNDLLIPNMVESYNSGPGQFLTRGGILSLEEPGMPAAPLLLCLLLLGCILVIGPLRLLVLRRLKRPMWWSWRLVLSSLLVFTFLAYGLIYVQKNVSFINNSISLIQINQDGTSAHITTYMGLFLPDQGDFHLNITGESLAQPVARPFLEQNRAIVAKNDEPTTITSGTKGTSMTIHADGSWAFNPVVSEQDQQLHGGLTSQLNLHDNDLVGSITNTLNTALSDVYILLPHSFVPIGTVGAGQTLQIKRPFHSSPPDAGETLANQIATAAGINASYLPDPTKQQAASPLQSHIALLSALSGGGYNYPACDGSCLTHSISSKGNIYVTGGQVPNPNLKNDYDPLLIPGAPATLIGWADQAMPQVDDTTINGYHPTGRHMNFIQMPLNLNFSGHAHIPLDLITGNLVANQGSDASALLPGIYSMSSGNVTFELNLPDRSQMTMSDMTITVPDLIAHPSGPGSGSPTHISNVQAQLYNWHTGAWNTIHLTQDAFTTKDIDAYAGPYGRILVEVSSQDASQIFFGKPGLMVE